MASSDVGGGPSGSEVRAPQIQTYQCSPQALSLTHLMTWGERLTLTQPLGRWCQVTSISQPAQEASVKPTSNEGRALEPGFEFQFTHFPSCVTLGKALALSEAHFTSL